MENNKNNNFTDALVCVLAMFFVFWILIALDKKIDKSDSTNPHRPIENEGHLRWADG